MESKRKDWSTEKFEKVWDVIQEDESLTEITDGTRYRIESGETDLEKDIDRIACIDFIVKTNSTVSRLISYSQRVQTSSLEYLPYETFTVAYKSDQHDYSQYERILYGVENGGMHSDYHIQGYLTDDFYINGYSTEERIRTIGIVKTEPFVYTIRDWLNNGGIEGKLIKTGFETSVNYGRTDFYVVNWKALPEGSIIYTYEHPDEKGLKPWYFQRAEDYANRNRTTLDNK